MREILFKGKRVDNGEWVFGSYIVNSIDAPCIIDYDAEQFEVLPETVSQYTGLKDKKRNKIFENDKVKAFANIYEVIFNDGAFYLKRENVHHRLSRTIQDLEIIGNIHEDGNK